MASKGGGKQVVVVFGATGHQGGSVARALAQCGEYTVRGVTRDLASSRAQDLKSQGVDLFNCDLNDGTGLQSVLRDADAVFVNTATDFCEPNCLDSEIAQGCRVADICKASNVEHVIFSSQLHSAKICSLMARHLVAKAEIESYMRSLGLPLTCLIMPVYYQDLCDIFRPRSCDGRCYDIEIPMGGTPLDMMSVDDVGQVVLSVLRNRNFYLHKTVSVCGDKITVREMAHYLNKYLRNKQFQDKQITVYDFHQRRANDLPGSADWANMFQFFMRVDQKHNLSETKKLNPNLLSFEQWVAQNAEALGQYL